MTSSSSVIPLRQPEEVDDPLSAVLRRGDRRLLAQAGEAEAEAFLATMKDLRLADGRERVRKPIPARGRSPAGLRAFSAPPAGTLKRKGIV